MIFYLLLLFIPLISYWIGNSKNKQGKTALGCYKVGIITGYIGVLLFTLNACINLIDQFVSGEGILAFLFWTVLAVICYIGTRKCEDGKEKELSRSGASADNGNTNLGQSTEEKPTDSQKPVGSFVKAGQVRFCPNCGADIPEGADHCEYCETRF